MAGMRSGFWRSRYSPLVVLGTGTTEWIPGHGLVLFEGGEGQARTK